MLSFLKNKTLPSAGLESAVDLVMKASESLNLHSFKTIKPATGVLSVSTPKGEVSFTLDKFMVSDVKGFKKDAVVFSNEHDKADITGTTYQKVTVDASGSISPKINSVLMANIDAALTTANNTGIASYSATLDEWANSPTTTGDIKSSITPIAAHFKLDYSKELNDLKDQFVATTAELIKDYEARIVEFEVLVATLTEERTSLYQKIEELANAATPPTIKVNIDGTSETAFSTMYGKKFIPSAKASKKHDPAKVELGTEMVSDEYLAGIMKTALKTADELDLKGVVAGGTATSLSGDKITYQKQDTGFVKGFAGGKFISDADVFTEKMLPKMDTYGDVIKKSDIADYSVLASHGQEPVHAVMKTYVDTHDGITKVIGYKPKNKPDDGALLINMGGLRVWYRSAYYPSLEHTTDMMYYKMSIRYTNFYAEANLDQIYNLLGFPMKEIPQSEIPSALMSYIMNILMTQYPDIFSIG